MRLPETWQDETNVEMGTENNNVEYSEEEKRRELLVATYFGNQVNI